MSIATAVFTGLTIMRDRPTNTPTDHPQTGYAAPSITKGCICAMQP